PEVHENSCKLKEKGFKVIRVQCGVPGAIGTYGVGGAAEAATANWGSSDGGPIGDGGPQPSIEANWEPVNYLSVIPKMFAYLRDRMGDEIELFHDAHEPPPPIQAARLARELEPYNLFFLEDPLRPEHKESFRLIRHHSTTPIAMGELFNTKYECLPLITEQLI